MNYVSYLSDLLSRSTGSVTWRGTHRDLVELVARVAATYELRDSRGYPFTIAALTRRAYHAVGLTPPHHVAAIIYQIRHRLKPMPPLSERLKPLAC